MTESISTRTRPPLEMGDVSIEPWRDRRHGNLMALREQRFGQVRSDESGAAGEQCSQVFQQVRSLRFRHAPQNRFRCALCSPAVRRQRMFARERRAGGGDRSPDWHHTGARAVRGGCRRVHQRRASPRHPRRDEIVRQAYHECGETERQAIDGHVEYIVTMASAAVSRRGQIRRGFCNRYWERLQPLARSRPPSRRDAA